MISVTEHEGKYRHTCTQCQWHIDLPKVCRMFCSRCQAGLRAQGRPSPRLRQTAPTPGLGDKIEETLAGWGVTKESWQEFKQRHGLPAGCSCPKRQAWFNAIGEAFPGVESLGSRLLDALKKRS